MQFFPERALFYLLGLASGVLFLIFIISFFFIIIYLHHIYCFCQIAIIIISMIYMISNIMITRCSSSPSSAWTSSAAAAVGEGGGGERQVDLILIFDFILFCFFVCFYNNHNQVKAQEMEKDEKMAENLNSCQVAQTPQPNAL